MCTGEGRKCAKEMGVGWGVWSWAIIGANRVEGGKGFACALSKGFNKMPGWDPTFTQRARGW
jgi:hypothetical protein